MSLSRKPDWIALDWGTSNLRAWAMSADGDVLAEASSDRGMGKLGREDFEPALLDLVGGWMDAETTLVACGMVGSRQGWVEAPYRRVPCTPLAETLVTAPAQDPRLKVHVIPGLRQDSPADVMRGEETQIAGFLAQTPNWDGVICLPGSHSKWAHLSAGEVVSFQTYMTGELYAALSQHTVLRHSIPAEGWDEAAFAEAVDTAISRPERIAQRLFGLRAEGLLSGLAPQTARARLSGLLIGLELAGAKPYWLGQNVAILGEGTLASAYAAALATLGVPATRIAADPATRAGLVAAWRNLTGAET